MKKLLLCLFFVFFSIKQQVKAQDDFFDNLIVDEQMKQDVEKEIAVEDGKNKASEILNTKPLKLQLDENLNVKLKQKEQNEIIIAREPAPFGLKWLATVDEIKYLNVVLKPKQVKDTPNSFIAENLPKPVKAFREVLVSFGENNALWRIVGYGQLINDDDKASHGLEEYRKFYDMLNKKYGNAHEFYTPAVMNIDEEVVEDDGTKTHKIKQETVEIGTPGFKEKLMSGQSTLYSTFENDHIGVTLALIADGNGQTFIIVDYKNLKVNETEKQEIFDAL